MNILRSKTIDIALLLGILGAVEQNMGMLRGVLGEYYGLSYVVIGFVFAVLRTVTTKPLSEK